MSAWKKIKSWKANHFLQLKENKTDVILVGSLNSPNRIINNIGPLSQDVRHHVRNLGVKFRNLKFHHQVKSHIKSNLTYCTNIKSFCTFQDLNLM